MHRSIHCTIRWLQSSSLRLVFLAGIILLVWGTFAPVRTVIWWLSQGEGDRPTLNLPTHSGERDSITTQPPSGPSVNCYIVFLTGVGDFSANQLAPGEDEFMDQLTQDHPRCVAVRDVFPYATDNVSLGGDRLLAPLWEAVHRAEGWLENTDVLIKIRNLWRFALSIDNRYGPIFNESVAEAIAAQMEAAHPLAEAEPSFQLILIGTSGGAQIALGAAQYLDRWLETSIIVLSVGGDFSGTEGFESADQIYHIQGRQDWVEDLSSIVFPARWPWVVSSGFNQAQRRGRYQVQMSGPHGHSGPTGYFGLEPVEPGSETTYLDLTLQKVNQLPFWNQGRNSDGSSDGNPDGSPE